MVGEAESTAPWGVILSVSVCLRAEISVLQVMVERMDWKPRKRSLTLLPTLD
jgi:hypothetical protein